MFIYILPEQIKYSNNETVLKLEVTIKKEKNEGVRQLTDFFFPTPSCLHHVIEGTTWSALLDISFQNLFCTTKKVCFLLLLPSVPSSNEPIPCTFIAPCYLN